MSMHLDEPRLLRLLYELNPWWTGGKVPDRLTKPFRRSDFFILRERIQGKRICAIRGPRQVGKTTIMYQLIEDLIGPKGLDPMRVLFVSFDHPYIGSITREPLNDILTLYTTSVLHEPIDDLRKPVFVFLDEICNIGSWSSLLKGWFDLGYPLRFTVSDSSGPEMTSGASESLVGRIEIYTMFSMKFFDHVRFYQSERLPKNVRWDLRRALARSRKVESPTPLFNGLRTAYETLVPLERRIWVHLNDYLLKDGYPELLGQSDLGLCERRLREYIELTLHKDLQRVFGIKDPRALDDLVSIVASRSSSPIAQSTLASNLSLRRETVGGYIDMLCSSFLISQSEVFSSNRSVRIRNPKKLYFTNIGLRNAWIGALNRETLKNPTELGVIAETVTYDHLVRLAHCIDEGPKPEIFYWRDGPEKEVDMVLAFGKLPVPIEVKFRNEIKNRDLASLDYFMDRMNAPFGIVVTKDRFEKEGRLIFVPLWLFLMIC